MLTTKDKKKLIKKFGKSEQDSGSTRVQVAILTSRINDLTKHFAKNKKDFHSRFGLLKMVGLRRSLLKYLRKTNQKEYQKTLKELKIHA